VAYRLDLPVQLEYVHNVFHISQLRKYVPDSNHAIIAEPVWVTENLAYEERPLQILDYSVKQFRNKGIPLVKVSWANHTSYEATWETEADMRNKYSYLFKVQPRFPLSLQVLRTKLILRGKAVMART